MRLSAILGSSVLDQEVVRLDGLVSRIDREIAALEARVSRLNATHAERVAVLGGRVEALRNARAALGDAPGRAAARGSARAKAGPAAIETVEAALKVPATQAKVTEVTGLNSGQVSAALRDLEERGVIRRTGAKEGRSFEFERVPVAS